MTVKKLLSLLLCAVMIISCSSSVFALGSISEQSIPNERYRVDEVTELRERNSDTYLLSDGTYECVVYAEDKYYLDIDGKFKEINNTIVPTDYRSATTTYKYGNAANSTLVYFSDDAPSVLIKSGNNQLAFSFVNSRAAKVQTGAKGNEYKFSEFDLRSDNCMTYAGVCEETDIVYSVNNGYVKEYIVLNSPNAPTEFQFEFDTADCYIKENDAGALNVYNSNGELAFEFGTLFAVDAAGKYTDNLKYGIVTKNKDTTIVSVSIDPIFLNDAGTAFPILIDPSVMVTGETNTYDTFVSSRYPTTNYYLYNWLRTGKDDDYYIRRTYIKFDIPSSVTKYISSASIYMRKYSGAAPNVRAYRVTSDWSSSGVTWNNKPTYSTTYGSSAATLASNNWYSFDVTRLVSLWKKGTYSNFGFLIKDTTESNTSQWTTFYSSDAASPNKPELRITYTTYDSTLMAIKEYNSAGNLIARNSYFSPVSSYVINNRGGNTFTSFFTSYSHASMVTRLQSTLLFFIHTHGKQSGVYLGNGDYFTISSLSGTDLSNMRCALLLTCNTGVGGYSSTRVSNNTPINIVERMVICGAKTVIGFKEVTYVSDCNVFAEQFAQRTMSSGYSIYNAIRNMDCSNFISDMSSTAVIGGNSSQTLNW